MLTRNGRLEGRTARSGRSSTRSTDLRVAGYDDPFERRCAESFRDRYDADARRRPSRTSSCGWLQPLIGKVDVVMVHEPALIQTALEVARGRPAGAPARLPRRPHAQGRAAARSPGVTVINGGSMGAGGTGNLAEKHADRRRALRLHARADLPAARRRPRLDRPRHAATPQRAARSWSWRTISRVSARVDDAARAGSRRACGTRTGRCPPPRRRCRWCRRSGVRLTLADGRELIDGMASWWCAIHGYRHPVIDAAVTRPARTAWRT